MQSPPEVSAQLPVRIVKNGGECLTFDTLAMRALAQTVPHIGRKKQTKPHHSFHQGSELGPKQAIRSLELKTHSRQAEDTELVAASHFLAGVVLGDWGGGVKKRKKSK